jgi:predicted ATP-dependent endonuclease of OLD family
MEHKFFEITNFKGISHVKINFEAQPRGSVYTLVGLNESGKTTILEAIDLMNLRSDSLGPQNLLGYAAKDVHELIPISKRSNFNDKIIIKAGYRIDIEDNEKIRKHLKAFHKFELTEDVQDFEIVKSFAFENSEAISNKPSEVWTVKFIGKKKGMKRARALVGEEWGAMAAFMRTMLPSILYFPNFLFEFPDKIYLEDPVTDKAKHAFYRTILQDVLDSIGDNTKLETHVLARAKAGAPHDNRALESVLLNMGGDITKRVFNAWNRIFKRSIGRKEIVVRHDKDEDGAWYLQLRLKDGNEVYSISERSLGFRWFFIFLLFTQYRGYRRDVSNTVLFLLDEPASNLHPSAQTQLLDSFGNFPANTAIIYTTHSHHMINPAWLENTFVVKNEGVEYEAEEDTYSSKKTVIALDRYRNFAAAHPDQSTYYQPVLDVLEYSPSKLENVPSVVMVEGKNDFYTLKYFHEKVLRRPKAINLMPGGGAGSLDNVIRLYLAWGREFIVILDSDTEGDAQKTRYEDLFGVLVGDRIFTLRDIDPAFKKNMEQVLPQADRLLIQTTAYPATVSYKKTHFNRAIQELYLTNRISTISATTIANFEKILEFCEQKLNL